MMKSTLLHLAVVTTTRSPTPVIDICTFSIYTSVMGGDIVCNLWPCAKSTHCFLFFSRILFKKEGPKIRLYDYRSNLLNTFRFLDSLSTYKQPIL
mmetsp:Transcript_9920/g.20661  ORF Transcript_9920/g.20661 Transcript_9920/m.20661 type:complete len:95 (+) Transcript_9920:64-348(+)